MFGDLIAGRLPHLQAAAEALMTEECTISRPGASEPDPLTGQPVETLVPVWSGPCQLRSNQPYEQNREAGESTWTTQRYVLKVPVGAPRIRNGDVARVGDRSFRVAAEHDVTHQTAQRLSVEEVT